MLRRSTTRQNSTRTQRDPRIGMGASRGSHLARFASLLLAISLCWNDGFAQHEGSHGGGYHATAPHASAPRSGPPRQQMPQGRPLPQGYGNRPPQGYTAHPPQSFATPQPGHGFSGPPNQQRPLITAQPAPYQRNTPGQPFQQSPGPRNQYAVPPGNAGRGNQHLGGWLQNHQGQSFASQENSLRQEPGFSRLPQPQQQRLIDRLHQLDAMPPQQRQRTLGRIENMESLSPERKQQVRNSAQEMGAMDSTRRQQVRGAFRSLRDLPPGDRQQELNSPAFRSQYSDHEREILGNLLSVEPYNPR